MSQPSMNQAAPSPGPKAAPHEQPGSTTSETLRWQEDRQLDVTVEVVKRLKIYALKHYNDAMISGAASVASYWDGYLRALSHVLEAENE